MKTIVKIVIGAAAVAIVAVVGIGILTGQTNNLLHDTSENAKASAANAALDASGYKDQLDQTLRSNVERISELTGLPASEVEKAIDNLDIASWKATPLPSDAKATGTQSGTYNGTSATITTYEDPNYITVSTGGQDITLEVPSSAQNYLGYLSYI